MKPLRTTFNKILAMAVLDLFPGVILGKSRVTETQFFYSFQFPQSRHPELLPLVEEKMREIVKLEPLIECIEMSVKSASAYFDHHEQPFKAEAALEAPWDIIPLIRIGKFYDLMDTTPWIESLSSSAFRLLEAREFFENDLNWIEISGTVFGSKEELKAFVKHRKQWLKDKPWEQAELSDLIFYANGVPSLLPKGVLVYQKLEAFWWDQIRKQDTLARVVTQNSNAYSSLSQYLKKGIAEWGAKTEDPFGPSDLCMLFPSFHQVIPQCISSLQFIHETFNMLELNVKWILCTKNPGIIHTKQWEHEVKALTQALEGCGFSYTIDEESCKTDHPSVELRVSDTLGEQWTGPFLSLSCGEKSKQLSSEKKNTQMEAFIAYSLLGPIKRLIALLAEQKVGKWLNVGES